MGIAPIFDSDYVLRRIYQEGINNDGTLKSTCFSDRHDSPSCHLEKLTTKSNILTDHPGVVVVAKLNVGEIIKKPNSANIDKKIRRKLVSITQIVKV